MAAPLILIEAQPRRVSDGVPVTVRLAGGGGAKPYRYAGSHWRAGITGLPSIVSSIDFKGDDLGGGGVSQAMELRWAPGRAAHLAELAALHWIDASITVRVGPEGALPPVLLTGKVLDAKSTDGVLTISLADPATDLKKPLLSSRFAGTGGIEGPLEWKDRIKSRAWGRLFNVQGFAIDPANSIYCFGDPMHAWEAITAVRDKGASAAALETIAWAGSAAATFAALQAADAPPGGGVTAPSIACVKWWTQPAGALCADIRGENAGGYVETAASIAARIAAVVSTTPFAEGTVSAANTARPIAVGLFAAEEGLTVTQAMDALLGDVSLLWMLDDGAIVIRPWTWGAPVTAARSHQVGRRSVFRPVGRRKLGYRRNQHVMNRDAIAGIVLASDVQFDDGQSAQELQPAAPGATPGAPEGTDIGGTLDPVTGGQTGGTPAEQVVGDTVASLLEQTIGLANAELARVRDRELLFPDDDGASIVTLMRRETTARTALALLITTVSAALGGTQATVQQLMQAFVGDEGGIAGFLLRAQVDEDGQPTAIVGIEGWAGAGSSVLRFIATIIEFLHPDTLERLIYFDTELGKMIAHSVEVDTLKVNTAVVPVRATASTVLSGGGISAAWQTALTVSIILPVPGWVEAQFVGAQSFDSGDEPWSLELLINDIVVFPLNNRGLTQPVAAIQGSQFCEAGTHTVLVRWRAHSSVDLRDRNLFVKAYPGTE